MDPELQKLEDQLRSVQPAGLDSALLGRLELAMDDQLCADVTGYADVETKLSNATPAALSDDLTARLLGTLDKVPFPTDDKVVQFPQATHPEFKRQRRSNWWAAAAAVAIAGGLSAFFVNPGASEQSGELASTQPSSVAPVVETPVPNPSAFMPASFDSGVSETEDMGVVWNQGVKPMRVVKVIYKDSVKFLNDEGEEVVAEVPRVEYLMVPEEVD